MTSQTASDLGRLILRGTLGIVLPDHGYNRVFGGGKIEGTARHLTDSYLEAIIPPSRVSGKAGRLPTKRAMGLPWRRRW